MTHIAKILKQIRLHIQRGAEGNTSVGLGYRLLFDHLGILYEDVTCFYTSRLWHLMLFAFLIHPKLRSINPHDITL